MELIDKYFELDEVQKERFTKLKSLYTYWNEQINVISRKDIDNFYGRHVLHSLGIAVVCDFVPGTKILDVGTGGGFPGIPLAIYYPDCDFVLLDSTGKKIKVVNEVVAALGLRNVKTFQKRAEEEKGKYDYIVSRAVTNMSRFIPWIQNNISDKQKNLLPNGILYLKGGDLSEELSEINYGYDIFDLRQYFEELFFETKKVVYVKMV